jgi:hypothetical protein
VITAEEAHSNFSSLGSKDDTHDKLKARGEYLD